MLYLLLKMPITSAAFSKKTLASIDKEEPVTFHVRLLELLWALINEWFPIPNVYVYSLLGTLYLYLIPQEFNNTTNIVLNLGRRTITGTRSSF